MADVMDEGQSFREVLVEVQGARYGSGDLGDLDGVGEARAEVIRGAGGEDLGLTGETAECSGLDDAFAVTLEGSALGVSGSGEGSSQELVVRVEVGDCSRIKGGRHASFSLAEVFAKAGEQVETHPNHCEISMRHTTGGCVLGLFVGSGIVAG